MIRMRKASEFYVLQKLCPPLMPSLLLTMGEEPTREQPTRDSPLGRDPTRGKSVKGQFTVNVPGVGLVDYQVRASLRR